MEARAVHVPDVLADPEYTWSGAQKIGGYRAALGAPLLHKGTVVGVIFVAKTVPQPFTAKQIELVTTFADQAVIAIENTRLLNELRHRTGDLSELLEQQTAASQVLQVISSSTGELEPVFQAILASATRTCDETTEVDVRAGAAGSTVVTRYTPYVVDDDGVTAESTMLHMQQLSGAVVATVCQVGEPPPYGIAPRSMR